jgi:cytochrome P450
MRELAVRVRARADELVARISPGEPFDAVETLAVPFPLWIIAELLGIPESDWPRFYQWSEASIPGATDWPPEECARLQAEMHEYLLAMTTARRGDPRDDIVSVLANADVDGESLRDDELVMFLNQLLVAGNETTRHAISGGIAALAERPAQWERLTADRSLVTTATEEILRWTTPVISFMRTATRDTQVRGVDIAAGDPLVLLYASANRDEEEFGPDADQFDVGRDPNHEVALGFGPHFCLGAALARVEIAAMLDALLDRFSSVSSAGAVERTASFVIAGITRAPVVCA